MREPQRKGVNMTLNEYVQREIADQLKMLGFKPAKVKRCRVAPPRIDVVAENGAVFHFWVGVTLLDEPWGKKQR